MPEQTFHSLTLQGADTVRVPLTANEFSPSTSYQIRDYCTYQGKLYICTAPHLGAWNSSDFSETNVGEELKGLIPIYSSTAPSNPKIGDLWIDTNS